MLSMRPCHQPATSRIAGTDSNNQKAGLLLRIVRINYPLAASCFAVNRLGCLPFINHAAYILLQMARPVSILLLTLLVTACGGRSEREVVRRDNDVFRSEPSRQCLSTLRAANVRFTPLPNQNYSSGCRTIDTVKLMSFSTEATNLGAMTCPLATNFTAWAKHAVEPAAKAYLGSEVVRIETMGTYNCRNINGGRSGRLSEHAFGNAVDVSAFILKNGRRVSVLSGWNGKADERAFLRRLHQSACKRFGTVLGPDYNAAHANHFHFDMAKSMKDGSAYCR